MSAAIEPSAADRKQAPAHDLDAEQAVLGILLNHPDRITDAASRLSYDSFYSPKHGDLFRLMADTIADGKPVGPEVILGLLADRGGNDIDRFGRTFIFEIYHANPSAQQLDYFIDRVAERASLRDLEVAGVRIAQAASAPGGNTEDIAALAAKLLAEAQPRKSAIDLIQLGSLINPCFDDIEARAERPAGISTGFTKLDQMLGGLRRKQLITVAAATGMGKTLLLVDFARHISIRLGLTVAFFSLEMSNEEVFDRVLSAETSVLHESIRDGKLGDTEWQKIAAQIGPMSNAPFFVSDRAPMNVQQIKRQVEILRQQRPVDVVIVDHMHLVDPSERVRDDTARITNVSRGLKLDLAMSLDVPVIAAAQFNRGQQGRQNKEPELSDLKGSSAIEQDSNVVLMLHRDDYYDANAPRRGEADIIVAKNRSGRKGPVPVAAQLHFARHLDMAVPA
jgi:replicative DNA helicase